MKASKPFILYTLTKGRATQALRQKKIEEAWESIKNFLSSCTDADPLNPQDISLTAYEPYHTDKDPEKAKKTIVELNDLLGPGETVPIAGGWPDIRKWGIKPDEFSKALDYLIAGQPWPPATFGPIELVFNYDFTFIDPTTRAVLPDQEKQSFIVFWLGRSKKCTMYFRFPFQTAGDDFWAYLKKIGPYLPFMIEEKYLKIGGPYKGRTRYISPKRPK